MAAIQSWLENNSALLQSVGIVFGLIFTGITVLLSIINMRRDLAARRLSDHLLLTELHLQHWSEIQRNPEGLGRVLAGPDDASILVKPMTRLEERFLNQCFVHYSTGWRHAKASGKIALEDFAADVRGFFTLPLPSKAWEASKAHREREFVHFVDECLRSIPSNPV